MSTGPTNLYDLMAALLAACSEALIAAGVGQDNEYVYPSQGAPPAICSSLVVGPGMPVIYPAVPAGSEAVPVRSTLATPRSAVLTVYSYRCLESAAGGEGLSVADIDVAAMGADSQAIFTDVYVLHKGILAAHYAGTFGDYTTGISIGEGIILQAQGGMGGCAVTVRSELS